MRVLPFFSIHFVRVSFFRYAVVCRDTYFRSRSIKWTFVLLIYIFRTRFTLLKIVSNRYSMHFASPYFHQSLARRSGRQCATVIRNITRHSCVNVFGWVAVIECKWKKCIQMVQNVTLWVCFFLVEQSKKYSNNKYINHHHYQYIFVGHYFCNRLHHSHMMRSMSAIHLNARTFDSPFGWKPCVFLRFFLHMINRCFPSNSSRIICYNRYGWRLHTCAKRSGAHSIDKRSLRHEQLKIHADLLFFSQSSLMHRKKKHK